MAYSTGHLVHESFASVDEVNGEYKVIGLTDIDGEMRRLFKVSLDAGLHRISTSASVMKSASDGGLLVRGLERSVDVVLWPRCRRR